MKIKITTWVSFQWGLADVELPSGKAPRQYSLTHAGGADYAELRSVIRKSLSLDPSWNPTLHEVNTLLQGAVDRALLSSSCTGIALRHGTRIIGAAMLDPAAAEHFVVGPCVLMEYRNRGLGTLLLVNALRYLREAKVTRPCAITREGAPVARFLYPKFGGIPSPVAPLLAA